MDPPRRPEPDGLRERRLLDHVRAAVPGSGDPQAVLKAIDSYAWSQEWLMNVGDVKGKIVDSALTASIQGGAKTFVEIGTYCGYSAIRIGSQLPEGSRLWTMEVSPVHAEVAQALVEHAGLSGKVQILLGDVEAGASALKAQGVQHIDWLFIDHWKEMYVRDFLYLRGQGLLPKGSVVVADNLLTPGAPDYLQLMREHPEEYSFQAHDTMLEYSSSEADIVGVTTLLV